MQEIRRGVWGRVFIDFLAYRGMKKRVKKVIKKRRLKAKCPKCGKRIVGKICYYQRKMFCRKCFSERKYEDGGRRRWVARGPRGRPPLKNLNTTFSWVSVKK